MNKYLYYIPPAVVLLFAILFLLIEEREIIYSFSDIISGVMAGIFGIAFISFFVPRIVKNDSVRKGIMIFFTVVNIIGLLIVLLLFFILLDIF